MKKSEMNSCLEKLGKDFDVQILDTDFVISSGVVAVHVDYSHVTAVVEKLDTVDIQMKRSCVFLDLEFRSITIMLRT